MDYRGRTALITGASSGLGEQFARQLAAKGAELVLVARSKDKLHLLAAELRGRDSVRVDVIAADLSSTEGVAELIDRVREQGIDISYLVNDAGVGDFKDFLTMTIDSAIQQISVNMSALVMLTHAYAPGMVKAASGGVINVASTAAFQPGPGAAIYAASKSFVLSFTEALAFELDRSGVRILAACPGPVATNFFRDKKPTFNTAQIDRADDVVREILAAFEAEKQIVFPGKLTNWLGTFGARLLPRKMMVRISAGVMKQLNAD